MPGITIQLPSIEADQSVEVEVKVNGQRKTYHYRIEIFSWEQCEEENRALCLRQMLAKHDETWQLIHIGSATEKSVPLMFRQMN